MESDENVKNILQLQDAKLEDTSKRTEPQNWELKHNKMLGILRKFVKAERTKIGCYICKPLEICCHALQQLVITLIQNHCIRICKGWQI